MGIAVINPFARDTEHYQGMGDKLSMITVPSSGAFVDTLQHLQLCN
jgi:hypothetical protein